jgi:hypothetical protein
MKSTAFESPPEGQTQQTQNHNMQCIQPNPPCLEIRKQVNIKRVNLFRHLNVPMIINKRYSPRLRLHPLHLQPRTSVPTGPESTPFLDDNGKNVFHKRLPLRTYLWRRNFWTHLKHTLQDIARCLGLGIGYLEINPTTVSHTEQRNARDSRPTNRLPRKFRQQ